MAISEARRKANKKWNDENMAKLYDRVVALLPKGKGQVVKEHAAERGESVSGFINRAIDETIERDNTK